MNPKIGLLERENEVIRLIGLFLENNLIFVVIGGYAISTYKKRFSVDLDVVIKEADFLNFEKLLLKEGYSINYEKEIDVLYGENFKRFVKKMNNLPVYVDLLINGLVSRTTNASWSFESIDKNSQKRKLNNLEFLTPAKELLTSMKIHSGRLSDVRDIIVLMPCNKNKLKTFLLRGDLDKLRMLMKKQALFLDKPQFDDSFKGIFGVQAYKQNEIESARKLFRDLLKEIK
ncbi:hypothetical protein J4221_03820 [Candidatus Pacearchaeota archaeon]|nr:hypothetical protein [Candidatus Pacearchaeota archaeon]